MAKIRWKLATARIVNLLGKKDKMSLVEKMKKNMKNSMLATVPDFSHAASCISFTLFAIVAMRPT